MTAAFLHFFFLSSFCWVLTEAWQSYLAVIGRIRTRLVRKRFLCLGWGKSLGWGWGESPCTPPCNPLGYQKGKLRYDGGKQTQVVSSDQLGHGELPQGLHSCPWQSGTGVMLGGDSDVTPLQL